MPAGWRDFGWGAGHKAWGKRPQVWSKRPSGFAGGRVLGLGQAYSEILLYEWHTQEF